MKPTVETNVRLGSNPRKFKRKLMFLLALSFRLSGTPAITAQTLVNVYSVEVHRQDDFPGSIHFYCLKDYNLATCEKHVFALRRELTHYPLGDLAPWSFVLVPSRDWEEMLRAAGGPPGSPAFTALHSRKTFFQDALFSPTPSQREQFMQIFSVTQNPLFELAVSHELGHVICRETDEQKATACGRDLRTGKGPPLEVHRSAWLIRGHAQTPGK